jgi:hypothetical protein
MNNQLIIELGVGNIRKYPNSVTVDSSPLDNVDVVGDALEYLESLPDSSVQILYASHFFEHIDNPVEYLCQFSRVIRNDGVARLIVPHFSNPYFYSDPTHENSFGLYTFSYYLSDNLFTRRVPAYARCSTSLYLSSVYIRFKVPKFLFVLYPLCLLLNVVINSFPLLQELYEFILSPIIPCYEIEYVLRKA